MYLPLLKQANKPINIEKLLLIIQSSTFANRQLLLTMINELVELKMLIRLPDNLVVIHKNLRNQIHKIEDWQYFQFYWETYMLEQLPNA